MLGTLQIGFNELTGQLPSSFVSTSLSDFRAEENRFTGQLSPEISLPNARKPPCYDTHNKMFNKPLNLLGFFYVNDNMLTGTIPEDLYGMTSLFRLRLQSNIGLYDPIPESISRLSSLREHNVSGTEFRGNLPSGLFDLSELQFLDLSDSAYSGPLSESFVNLPNIQDILLANNKFTGTIPSAFEQLPSFVLSFANLCSNDFLILKKELLSFMAKRLGWKCVLVFAQRPKVPVLVSLSSTP
jgi:hypothetical protein